MYFLIHSTPRYRNGHSTFRERERERERKRERENEKERLIVEKDMRETYYKSIVGFVGFSCFE